MNKFNKLYIDYKINLLDTKTKLNLIDLITRTIQQAYNTINLQSAELDMLIKQSLEQKEVVLKMEEFEQYLLDYGVNNNFNGSEFALDLRNKNVRNMVDFIKNKRLPNLEKL